MPQNNEHNHKVTLVIPVYNEQGCIVSVISSWHAFLSFKKINFKILAVNDGSTDRTPILLDSLQKELEHLEVIHKENGGHGSAITLGYNRANQTDCDWIFQVDSDNQFIPEDFMKIWENRNKSNFILGCRHKRNDPTLRLMISFTLKVILRILFQVKLKDPNIPFRLIKKETLNSILNAMNLNVFAPNIFLSIIGAKLGHDLLHIPVTHIERQTGEVSIVRMSLIKACFRSFKELLIFLKNQNKVVHKISNKVKKTLNHAA